MKSALRLLLVGLVLGMLQVGAAGAETTELRVAKQYGLGYLQMMVMEEMKLVEKHTKAAGLGDVKVNWSTFRSSDVMNDALLSGNLDFASLGTNGLAIIWAKTKGTPVEVKGAAGFNFLPLALVTRDAERQDGRGLHREAQDRRPGRPGLEPGHPAPDGGGQAVRPDQLHEAGLPHRLHDPSGCHGGAALRRGRGRQPFCLVPLPSEGTGEAGDSPDRQLHRDPGRRTSTSTSWPPRPSSTPRTPRPTPPT